MTAKHIELPTEDASPPAESLIESLGCFGYELKTAMADVIDNSITAGASNVWIRHLWDGVNSWISIRDDGKGMSEKELGSAMRPGGRSPNEDRDKADLGRFGLGLKSASFSQCRLLTVRSKKKRTTFATRCWDRDLVVENKSWDLIVGNYESTEVPLADLSDHSHGTIVVWEKMNRIIDDRPVDDEHAKIDFLTAMQACEEHIAMVFHMFMLRPKSRVNFFINGNQIKPWDPFLAGKGSTLGEVQELPLDGHVVRVEPFVLPHHSRISPELHKDAAGPKGWNAHQGFYLYRNHRLIVPGTWLDLGLQAEEHCKLARIRVDVPNALDHLWKVDVRKSQAEVPLAIRKRLRNIARDVRSQASDVYRYRGRSIQRRSDKSDKGVVWKIRTNRGKYSYRINRDYPVLTDLLASLDNASKRKFKVLLRIIEETIPATFISVQSSEHPDSQEDAFESSSEKERYAALRCAFDAIVGEGNTTQLALRLLERIEPFSLYPELIQKLAEDVAGEDVST